MKNYKVILNEELQSISKWRITKYLYMKNYKVSLNEDLLSISKWRITKYF